MSFLAPFTDRIYAVLRIVVGFLFALHGAQKILGWFGGAPEGAPAFIQYGAGGIELVGGLLVMVGLFTGPAAFLCSGTMAAAYFIAHQAQGALPIQNGGEPAALYAFVFLFLAAKGSGVWSVDDARGGDAG